MLFTRSTLEGIIAGRITLAFRRWPRPRVKPGGRQLSPLGVVGFVAVDEVEAGSITPAQARRAGHPSRASLLDALGPPVRAPISRIRQRAAGPDPRAALRARASLGHAELQELRARLARLDAAAARGPWTRRTLQAIARAPGVRAADLAAALGAADLRSFKTRVRKLNALGLTESLEVGYRLSPRGRAVLRRLRTDSV